MPPSPQMTSRPGVPVNMSAPAVPVIVQPGGTARGAAPAPATARSATKAAAAALTDMTFSVLDPPRRIVP